MKKSTPQIAPIPQPIAVEKPFTFETFMRNNPRVRDDLFGNGRRLTENIDWKLLDKSLSANQAFKDSTSLYQILTHYREILET